MHNKNYITISNKKYFISVNFKLSRSLLGKLFQIKAKETIIIFTIGETR